MYTVILMWRGVILVAPGQEWLISICQTLALCVLMYGTQKFVSGPAIACRIQEPSDAKCVSLTYSIGTQYSEICGAIAGYQKGTLQRPLTTTSLVLMVFIWMVFVSHENFHDNMSRLMQLDYKKII